MKSVFTSMLFLIAFVFCAPNAQASWNICGEATKLYEHSTQHYKNDSLTFYKEFNRLLTQNDLMGTPSSRVIRWFGEPYKFSEKRLTALKTISVQIPVDEPGFTSIYYRIPRDSEKVCFHVLRFKLKNDKIVQWSFVYNNEETKPITTNAVLLSDNCGSLQFNESKDFRYPKTVAKSNLIKKSRGSLVDEATRIEGPLDKNIFNYDPPVLDERLYK
ncbi:hypothetical protein KA183_08610 [bacterium]|nr:hypothetical protein [bacterium]